MIIFLFHQQFLFLDFMITIYIFYAMFKENIATIKQHYDSCKSSLEEIYVLVGTLDSCCANFLLPAICHFNYEPGIKILRDKSPQRINEIGK